MTTKFISRSEEFILLAVLYLEKEAYGVAIREHLKKMTGETWAFGAVFVMLNRLEKKGYFVSRLADPTPQRGGKSKRIYSLTPEGLDELKRIKNIHLKAWEKASASTLLK
jgi:PadR family transcriptional regulator, regulatory protein PadR